MESEKDYKRKRDKHDENESRREKKKRPRTRSRTPDDRRDRESGKGRRKRRHSRSQSPNRPMKQERQRVETSKNVKTEVAERKTQETDMLNTRTGGAYIPPARLRMMQAQITDKSSVAYQRLAWEALKKSIHGHINKINVGNIGIIIKELLKENIVRGRGLLCRSVIQAQAASPTFTNVYAALVAAVNSRFPNIGELLLKRLVIQFKRGFKRNDKAICISSASFIAHLVNQKVAHEILALELLTLLVETPTDDSVEVSIAFLKECGQKLTEVSSKGVNAIFEMLRNILHEGQLDKRVQYMIEVMFQVWKDGFKDHPAVIEELELVPEEEQFTHLLMLDDATDSQDILNVFKFDDKYEENEQKYKTLSKEILGSDAESGEEDESGESGSDESDEEEEEGEEKKEGVTIIDNTETNLVALRRTIYLTINSSLDFEECAHKLMKMQLKPGQEVELCHMFLDCCAEQRTYEKFYGLLAQRFCNINRMYIGPFEEIFKDSYATAHRLDTNRLRNVSKFFAHLLFTDSISWEVLECVRLNEEDTTSSSRIYIKILFQELAEYMGLKKLNDRLKDPTLQEAFSGVFPRDNPKNTRFSINFFTSIGLGGLTDELREHLKQMPRNIPPPITEIKVGSESSSDSSSSSSSSESSSDDSSSDSSSDSEEESNKKQKAKKKNKDNNKNEQSVQKSGEDESTKNKDPERWGHDGFYDTYGKNACREEGRKDRHKGDNREFVKRQDPKRIEGKERKEKEYHQDMSNGNDYRQNKGNMGHDEKRSSKECDDESNISREKNKRKYHGGERANKIDKSNHYKTNENRDTKYGRDDERSNQENCSSRHDKEFRDNRPGRDERRDKRQNTNDERHDKRQDTNDERRDKRQGTKDERCDKRQDTNDERRDKRQDTNNERRDKRQDTNDERQHNRRDKDGESHDSRCNKYDEKNHNKNDIVHKSSESKHKRDDDSQDFRHNRNDETCDSKRDEDRKRDKDKKQDRDHEDRDLRKQKSKIEENKKEDARKQDRETGKQDKDTRKQSKDRNGKNRSSKKEKSNDSDDEQDKDTRKQSKDRIGKDRSSKKEKSNDSDDQSSRRRNKKRDRDDKDGWDIRRAGSVRKEFASRYWET